MAKLEVKDLIIDDLKNSKITNSQDNLVNTYVTKTRKAETTSGGYSSRSSSGSSSHRSSSGSSHGGGGRKF